VKLYFVSQSRQLSSILNGIILRRPRDTNNISSAKGHFHSSTTGASCSIGFTKVPNPWLIDTLKQTVPIWKKEYFEDGAVWADGEPFPEEIVRPDGTIGAQPASK